jgi:hypothetical protein
MFLATVPGPPNTTQVTIHAEPGTPFADYYGAGDVVASRATFLRPNNIVNNSSRGELAWTTYPPYTLNCPPPSSVVATASQPGKTPIGAQKYRAYEASGL